MFALPTNKAIFKAIEQIFARSGDVSSLAVASELESTGSIAKAGGEEYVKKTLHSLFAAPGSMSLEIASEYRQQLLRARSYRTALKAFRDKEHDIINMRADLNEILDELNRALLERQVEAVTIKEHIKQLVDDLENVNPLEVFDSGIASLDKALGGGIQRGELLVVGANTGGGKSIFLYQSVLQALLAGKKVLAFSLEMPAKSILLRMASNLAEKRIIGAREKATRGAFLKQENIASENEIATALSSIARMPLIIHDQISEVGAIEAEIRRVAGQGKADLVVVDYIQIVTASQADTREQAISELTRRLKLVSLSANVAVMTASQLNEEGALRESRAISHHADFVVKIEHEENYRSSQIKISKNRRGAIGTSVEITMRGEISRLEEGSGKQKDPY